MAITYIPTPPIPVKTSHLVLSVREGGWVGIGLF